MGICESTIATPHSGTNPSPSGLGKHWEIKDPKVLQMIHSLSCSKGKFQPEQNHVTLACGLDETRTMLKAEPNRIFHHFCVVCAHPTLRFARFACRSTEDQKVTHTRTDTECKRKCIYEIRYSLFSPGPSPFCP